MRPIRLRWLVMTGMFAAMLVACTPDVPGPRDPEAASAEADGHALRAAIDAEYKRLTESRTFKMPATEITSTIERFVPVGSPFARAELVLKAAGLTIDPSRTFAPLHPNSYALRARVEPYPGGWEFFSVCRQTLSIELWPMAEMQPKATPRIDPASVDWSKIRRVYASIFDICL